MENIFQRHNGIFFIQESFDFAKLEFCALTEWEDARLYTQVSRTKTLKKQVTIYLSDI